jgi:putative sigma-54 modulation protein
MLIITKGKNLEVTPGLHELAVHKMARLTRYASEIRLVEVEFAIEHTRSVVDRQIVQATLELDGSIYRAEERAGEMRVALDAVAHQLQHQLKNRHSRERTRVRGRAPGEQAIETQFVPEEYQWVSPVQS